MKRLGRLKQVCWHCHCPLVLLQESENCFRVECVGPDIVCGVEGIGPDGVTQEDALRVYSIKFNIQVEML